jgi:hypothetical protein
MSAKEKTERSEIQILRDTFEGMKGRQPKSDNEQKSGLPLTKAKRQRCLSPRLFRVLVKLDAHKRPFRTNLSARVHVRFGPSLCKNAKTLDRHRTSYSFKVRLRRPQRRSAHF